MGGGVYTGEVVERDPGVRPRGAVRLSPRRPSGYRPPTSSGTRATAARGEAARLDPNGDRAALRDVNRSILPVMAYHLVTRSAVGRATADRRWVNDTDPIALRRPLAGLGLFPEVVG